MSKIRARYAKVGAGMLDPYLFDNVLRKMELSENTVASFTFHLVHLEGLVPAPGFSDPVPIIPRSLPTSL
jgi:hypothetical protein